MKMQTKFKKIFFATVLLFTFLLFVTSVKAGIDNNVTGWAWSSNIGWISFNSINPPGTALNFSESGGGGSGEYVYVSNTDFGLSETTVEAWIRPQPSTDERAPIVRMDKFYFQVFENNRLAAYWYGKSPAGFHYSSINSVKMDEWSHVAVVWDGLGVRFYINGSLDNPILTSGTGESTDWVSIGQENASRRYNGMIDDVRIWNSSRTEQQIRDTMVNPLRGNEEGLIGYWNFNEGSGESAFDSSPSGNTGSIEGAGWVTQPDFGVNIGIDGNMTGYAWSSNIGWIHFDPSGPYPQEPSYSGIIDIYGDIAGCGERGLVCGWARACSVFQSGCSGLLKSNDKRGNWDGWIFLGPADGNLPGIRLEEGDGSFDIRGYSWGSEVVGWLNFDCIDDGNCLQSPFQARTTYLLNSPPEILSSDSTLLYCAHGLTPQAAIGLSITLNWEYFDRDGDEQNKYEIHLSEDNNFPENNRFERVGVSSVGGYSLDPTHDGSWQNELDWNTTYYWRIRAHDGNFWSEWQEDSFTVTRIHPSPLVAFSYSPEQISVGEVVTFMSEDDENVSQVYDGSTPIYNWNFEQGNPSTSTSSTATTTFEQQGDWSSELKITDGSGYECSLSKDINIKVPLPDWKEVTPFGWVRTFVASIVDMIFRS